MKKGISDKDRKIAEYSAMIMEACANLFEDGSFEEDLNEGENLTLFMHALANVVPSGVYSSITGVTTDLLGFNHISNRLIFQYSTKEDEE